MLVLEGCCAIAVGTRRDAMQVIRCARALHRDAGVRRAPPEVAAGAILGEPYDLDAVVAIPVLRGVTEATQPACFAFARVSPGPQRFSTA